jgi:tetratricopeptide (TPR) repeat protein
MGQATIVAPDSTDQTVGARLLSLHPPALKSERQTSTETQNERPDAKAISRAVIHHLKGDLAAASKALQEVEKKYETADLFAARGYIQSELGNFAAASQAYSELVEKEPGATEGWFQWGYCLYKQGNVAEALERFEKAATLRTDWIEIPMARSICHLSLKQLAAAFEQVDECLRMNASYQPALFTKAVAFHVTWELEQAARLYCRVLELDPNCAEALMNLITVGLQQKQYDDVRRYSEQLAALQPDNALAIEGLATSAFNSGDLESAWRHYTRLVELVPDQVSHWLNLGVTNEKRDKLPDAIKAYTKAREIRPDSLYAHTYLGAALWKSGDLAAARECYEPAVSKWPEKEDLTLSLAQVLEELGRLEAAQQVCAQFCERSPDRKQVWFRLGYLQFQRDMAEAAAESFAKALKQQPVWPEAEINLSLACYRSGQLERAEGILVTLLSREPANLEALKGLATVTLAQNRNERSLELHELLLEHGGPDADVSYNCGVLAQKLNDLRKAVQFYRDAIAVRPGFPEALLNLGHAMKTLGNDDDARAAWIPALELRPEFALRYFRKS